jgi:hypothetical protein
MEIMDLLLMRSYFILDYDLDSKQIGYLGNSLPGSRSEDYL